MSFLATPLRYWHTLRHLRGEQWWWRLRRSIVRPTIDLRPAPERSSLDHARWTTPIVEPRSLLSPGRYRFLNLERDVVDPLHDEYAHLWRYHYHYFDDLAGEPTPERDAWRRAWIVRWLEKYPPSSKDAWDPYPTSVRIVNWIKWALAGNDLPSAAIESLAVQLRMLAAAPEYHLLGNHLLANAKALVFGGVFFAGEEARNWLRQGLAIYDRELPEQVLPDGGHFELSPMYHAIILNDLLDVTNAARCVADTLPEFHAWSSGLRDPIARMRRWAKAMTHPDGGIAFFNDATFGQAHSVSALDHYAVRLELGPAPTPADGTTVLEQSGYVRYAHDGTVFLADVGRIGPDYLPGHAHADTLSFELSVQGIRALVNSGISRYGDDAPRVRQRGTAAHNSVVVDGCDSSEVWSGFRVARRARPFDLRIDAHRDELALQCSHDGYRRLPGRVVHTRSWKIGPRSLNVEDRISGRYSSAVARFHFAPGWRCAWNSATHECVAQRDSTSLICRVTNADSRLEPGLWHPGFNLEEEIAVLSGSAQADRFTHAWSW